MHLIPPFICKPVLAFLHRRRNITLLLVPKHGNCLVVHVQKLLNELIHSSDSITLVGVNTETDVVNLNASIVKDKHRRFVIFGHSHPDIDYLLMKGEHGNVTACNINWNLLFDQINILYGHICFGSLLFQKKGAKKPWISYNSVITMLFENPDTDKRWKALFQKLFNLFRMTSDQNYSHNCLIHLFNEEAKALRRMETPFVGKESMITQLHTLIEAVSID